MCVPPQAALAALEVGGAGADLLNQRASIKTAKQQQQLTFSEGRLQIVDLGTREIQETAAAAATAEQIRRESLEAAGTAVAAASEQGGSGASFVAVVDDFVAQEGRNRTTNKRNLDFTKRQLDRERESIQTSLRLSRPIQPFDYLGATFKIGTAGAAGYAQGQSLS